VNASLVEISVPDSLLALARNASIGARSSGLKGDDQLRAVVEAVVEALMGGDQ
jgi:hypothetical protein